MLEDDLQLLKSLFEAEGEGLSKAQIEELCAPLAGLLVVMQLDSGILMSNYKQVPLISTVPCFPALDMGLCLERVAIPSQQAGSKIRGRESGGLGSCCQVHN